VKNHHPSYTTALPFSSHGGKVFWGQRQDAWSLCLRLEKSYSSRTQNGVLEWWVVEPQGSENYAVAIPGGASLQLTAATQAEAGEVQAQGRLGQCRETMPQKWAVESRTREVAQRHIACLACTGPSSVPSTRKQPQNEKGRSRPQVELLAWEGMRRLQVNSERMLFLSPNKPSFSSVWRKGWRWVPIIQDSCDKCLCIALRDNTLSSSVHLFLPLGVKLSQQNFQQWSLEIGHWNRPAEAGAKWAYRLGLGGRVLQPGPYQSQQNPLFGNRKPRWVAVLETINLCSSHLYSSATVWLLPGIHGAGASKWLATRIHRMAKAKGYHRVLWYDLYPLLDWEKWAPGRLTALFKGTQLAHCESRLPLVFNPKGLPTVIGSNPSPTTRPPSPLAGFSTHF
jgi:hypothetical protein